MRKLILSFILSLSSMTIYAELPNEQLSDKCSKTLTHSGDILIQRNWNETDRYCFISIHPMTVKDLFYRDYLFTNDGMMLVFNSYGEGSNAETTASRTFYLFPQKYDYPDFTIEDNGDVTIRTTSGHHIVFDSIKMKIKSFPQGTFTEKPLSKNNKGGVEINPSHGYLIDVGFKMGGMAVENKTGQSFIRGSKSGQCKLKNTELFSYKNADDYVYPFLKTGSELDLFLQNRCNIQF